MTQRKRRLGWLCTYGVIAASFLLLAAISVSAQISTGTILGVVKDATGGAVAGANVTVTNTDTGLVRTGTTQDDGSYRFPALPVGDYEVRVMKEGFQVEDRKGIVLEVGQEAAIDVTLQVGSTGQTVTVTEEAPQVDTTSSTLGGQVEEQKIQDLPLNGRNYVDLTIMQAGVTQSILTYAGTISPLGVTGTTYSSNGAPLRSNLQTLDGAIMSNVIGLNATSVIGTTLGVDGIKEYKVVTSMYSAEYGLVIGGQTTMVSKGGTNQWHGDVFEYLRNSAMDARNYYDALDTANHYGFGTDKSLPFPGKRIPPFERNQFGGSFGGPIRKDKTFFYAVYEGLRLSQGLPITSTNSFNKGCFYGSNTSPTGPFALNNSVPLYIDNATTGASANPYSIVIGASAVNAGALTACTTPATVNGVPNSLITVGCPLASIESASSGGCATGMIQPNILTIADAYLPLPNVAYGVVPAGPSAGMPAQTLSFNYTYPFKEPQNETYAQLRVDQNFGVNDSAFFRYTADLSNQISNEPLPAFVDHYKSQGLLASVGETHIFSPTLLNTARVSYSRSGLNFLDIVAPGANAVALIPGQSDGCCGVGNGVSGPPAGITPGDIYQNIFTVSDDVNWTKGKHAFKFGVLFNRFNDLLDLQFGTRGSMSFSTNQTFFEGNWSSVGYTPAIEGYGLERIYNYNTIGVYAQDDYRILPRVTLNLGLRYEIMTTPTAPAGLSYNVVNPEVSTMGTLGPPFLNPSLHAFSPRVGFAWDIFGDGKTALRGGAGIYYDIGNTGNLFATNDTGGPPLSVPKSFSNTGTAPPVPAGFGAGVGGFPLLSPAFLVDNSPTVLANIRVIQYHLKQPAMGQWNLTLDRQLPWGMAVTVAYVGNSAWHQTQLIEGNPTIPIGLGANGLPIYGCYPSETYGFTLGTTAPVAGCSGSNGGAGDANVQSGPHTNQNCTVNIGAFNGPLNLVQGPCWGTALISSNGGNTTYNALQLGLNKRLSHGLQFQFNYTWSHALDDCVKTILDVDSTSSCETPQYLFQDKGSSYNDIRDNIRTNVIYHLPDVKSDAFYAKPLHGWWIGSIISWQTGYPITVSGIARDLSGNVDTIDRPNLDPSYNASTGVTGNPSGWFNPTMFDVQPVGTIGNAGRAVFRGPRLVNQDFNINKDTKLKWLGEQGSLEFRAEIFNIYNHPNFAPPGGGISLASPPGSTTTYTTPSGQYGSTTALAYNTNTVGAISRTTTKSRQVQLALKVVF